MRMTCSGGQDQRRAPYKPRRHRDASPLWTALPGLTAIDLYQPVRGGTHDPFNSDGTGPLLMAMLQFSSQGQLEAGLSDPRSSEAPAAGRQCCDHRNELRATVLPVSVAPNRRPLRAPFSYVVRYHHPAENPGGVRLALHRRPSADPRQAARRSGRCCAICRSVRLGTAILPPADYMVGNEVVFDSPEAFNAAMASPVRLELREHFESFRVHRQEHALPMMCRQVLPR